MPDVKVNGVRLSYNVYGDSGPSVLLAMGVGVPAAQWQIFAVKPLLAAGYRIFTYDHRGTPPSEVPDGPYTIETFADDMIGLIEALELSDIRLWGVSVGGLICQEVTRRRPDLIRGVICHAGFGRHSAYGLLHAQAMVDLMRCTDNVPVSVAMALTLKDSLRPRALHDDAAVTAALDFLMAGRHPWSVGFASQLSSVIEWSKRDHTPEISQITRPVLVLAAEHDASFPPAQLKALAALLPQGEFDELAGANHVPLYGHKALMQRCIAFFDSLATRDAPAPSADRPRP